MRQRPLVRHPRNIAGVFSKRSPRAISCRPPLSWQAPRRFQRRQPKREGNNISGLIQRVREGTPAARGSLVLVICAGALAGAAFLPPITQPQAYHQFADQRHVFGLPHAFDVLSNATFLIAGLLGLWFVLGAGRTLDAGTRWALALLFLGLVLTTLGSAYYHLAPDDQRLVFDRMPITIVLAGCIGTVLADRFGGATAWSVAAFIAVGLWTVHHWGATGDLRWYFLFQALAFVFAALLLLLFPSRNNATPAIAIALLGNVAAKIFELLDRPIYSLGGVVSGHTLKHLSAGLAFLPLAFLIRRIGQQRMVDDSMRPDLRAARSAR
jgi:hypothetical protein